ncbi:MAG: glycerophosphodiester phosphodiesterase [Gemmatimonadota bacterium]
MTPARSPRPGHPYLAGAPLLVAHRGGSLLAPENTLFAFRLAVHEWWADMLETDVRLSKDGAVVVIHDATVDRTTDGTGAVADHTVAEIQSLDAGYHFVDEEGEPVFRGRGITIPTLDEVLEEFPSMRINVEAKEPAVAEPLARVIARHGAEHRVLIAAEYEKSRRGARGYPGPWGASFVQILLFWLLHRLPGGSPYTPGADVLQVPERRGRLQVVTPRFVREAHRHSIPVQVWTVNREDDMRRLLDWGVDGIQTDRPDILSAVLTERVGRPVPPGARTETDL